LQPKPSNDRNPIPINRPRAVFYCLQFTPTLNPARAVRPTPRLRALSGKKNAVMQSPKTAPALAAFTGEAQLQKTQKNAIAII